MGYNIYFPLVKNKKCIVLPIGDSLTLGFPGEYGYPISILDYNVAKSIAKGGWTIDDALAELEKGLSVKPKAILFWLGVNDELQNKWSVTSYVKADKLLKELAPGAKIIYGGLPEVPALPLAYHRNLELIYAGFNPLLFKLNSGDIWKDNLHLTKAGYRHVAKLWETRLECEGVQ